MDVSVAQNIVAVTGRAAGIGLATCKELLERNFAVAVIDQDTEAAEVAAAGMKDGPRQVISVSADVRDTAEVDAAIATVITQLGGLDVLVNCAGTADRAPASKMTDQSWSRLIDVHLSGTFRCCRAAFPALCKSNAAAIVNMSSVAAHTGFPLRASYCAAKGGIESLTRSLAVEWACHGIRVNAVAPTWVRTAILKNAFASGVLDEETINAITPLGGVVEPDEVAKIIAFLSSSESKMITG